MGTRGPRPRFLDVDIQMKSVHYLGLIRQRVIQETRSVKRFFGRLKLGLGKSPRDMKCSMFVSQA